MKPRASLLRSLFVAPSQQEFDDETWTEAFKLVEERTRGGLLFVRLPFAKFMDDLLSLINTKFGLIVGDNMVWKAVELFQNSPARRQILSVLDDDPHLAFKFEFCWNELRLEMSGGATESTSDDTTTWEDEEIRVSAEVFRQVKDYISRSIGGSLMRKEVEYLNAVLLKIEAKADTSGAKREEVKHVSKQARELRKKRESKENAKKSNK